MRRGGRPKRVYRRRREDGDGYEAGVDAFLTRAAASASVHDTDAACVGLAAWVRGLRREYQREGARDVLPVRGERLLRVLEERTSQLDNRLQPHSWLHT